LNIRLYGNRNIVGWVFFKDDGLLHKIIEKIKGKQIKEERMLQMLHNLTNVDGYVAFKVSNQQLKKGRDEEKNVEKICSKAED